MEQLTYHEGNFSEGNPMIMGPLDQSFWFATMIFDGARAFDGVMPDIELHMNRCINSARVMGMEPKETAEDLIELAADMSRKFPADKQLYIRPTYWSGRSDSLWAVAELTKFLMVLEVAPMEEPKGFSTCLSDLRRPAPDMAPTLAKASCLYPTSGEAVRRARQTGYDNAVMLDHEGNVAEFATANLFYAKDGQVHTPVPNDTFLNGITRQRVTGLLRDAGMDVVERTISYAELSEADEIFSTGNYSKVIPCTKINDREIQPGPAYRKARELYFDFARDAGFKL
jgi:branched-chain amino acid aminotransferase